MLKLLKRHVELTLGVKRGQVKAIGGSWSQLESRGGARRQKRSSAWRRDVSWRRLSRVCAMKVRHSILGVLHVCCRLPCAFLRSIAHPIHQIKQPSPLHLRVQYLMHLVLQFPLHFYRRGQLLHPPCPGAGLIGLQQRGVKHRMYPPHGCG